VQVPEKTPFPVSFNGGAKTRGVPPVTSAFNPGAESEGLEVEVRV
jgi:hypothetical protein